MAAPFVFGFGAAGLVTAVIIGAVVVGLALASSGRGRGSISISAHAAYDTGIAVGLIGSAILLGIAGDTAAMSILFAAGVLQVALSASTRYTMPARA